jgi:hypothetical protein
MNLIINDITDDLDTTVTAAQAPITCSCRSWRSL